MTRSNKESQGDSKAMKREINAEAARRSRRKKRQMQEEMEKVYDENERRIAHLERTVQELSSELRGSPFEQRSHSYRSLEVRQGRRKSDRPEWFGDPF